MAVGSYLGVTLKTVREMDVEEFYMWIEFIKLENAQQKASLDKGRGAKSRRSR
jgi:hypothetical protein